MKKPFIDRVKIIVRAGRGGNGCVSFRREKYVPRGGPDGGGGGTGGSIFWEASPQVATLIDFYYRPEHRAEDGQHGRGKKKQGRNGKDLIIRVPCGTVVREEKSGTVLHDMVREGERVPAARGGRGGRGNASFATSTNQAPRNAEEGSPGEEKNLILELKLIADIGLVGYPNSGKSTLLSRISRARPKIAAYPFTTLRPVLGIMEGDESLKVTAADIPGLIEGAHRDVGLGHEFLRHIERSRVLLMVLDIAGVDGRDPLDDYRNLRRELELHAAPLPEKPFLIAANKMDLPSARENLKNFVSSSAVPRENIYPISALKAEGIDRLKEGLFNLLAAIPDEEFLVVNEGNK